MTKQLLLTIAIAGSLLGIAGCTTEGYIETQPADIVYTRPIAPGPDYVWVDGDWVWIGGRYTWHQGYWRRTYPGRVWIAGNWDHTPRGYHWRRGHWR